MPSKYRFDPKNFIPPKYWGLHRDIQAHKHDTYRLKGGRGSLKTSTIIVENFTLMLRYPELCCAVFMKQANRLRQGAFAAYLEMLKRCKLDSLFDVSLSPMRLRNRKTGQIIGFFGLDSPEKTKGINTGSPGQYWGLVHFEELDSFSGPREIEIALDSLTRGGNLSWVFQCYNPPRNANNWVNKDSLLEVPGRLVHSSTYKMVPAAWLGTAFFDRVRQCKERNEEEYRWRYLGEVVGMSSVIFRNIKQWNYSKEKEDSLMLFHGLDLGWSDPKAFIRCGYSVEEQSLYLLDEFYESQCPNERVASFIAEHGYIESPTIIESAGGREAQPAYTAYGIPTDIVSKGNNLKMNGIDFLSSRKAIYIDPVRTPNAWDEFVSYQWKTDADNNVLSPEVPLDGHDHTIDATRYGISKHIAILGGLH